MNATISQPSDKRVTSAGEHPFDEQKMAEIEVNGKKVNMPEGPASGLEIKTAAIEQGVEITMKFVLHQEMPNGTGQIIGNDDKVEVRDHLSFTAIAPDDNS